MAQIKKPTYYYCIKQRTYIEKNADVVEEIKKIFEESNLTYGYRRITAVLRKTRLINSKKVLKIMRILGLKPGIKKRKKYSSYQGEVGKIASNLIKRNFKADKPYTKRFTDVSEFNLNGYKLYLSPFIDGFNQEIVGFSIGKSPNMRLVMESLNKAILKGQKEGADFSKTIIHSDQGWQYQNKNFRLRLNDSKIIQSMSRKGNCNDNGLMEGFFGLLKNEMFYGKEKTFSSIEDLKNKIEDYIDFYNNRRIKTGLNALSPVDYKKVKAQASKKV